MKKHIFIIVLIIVLSSTLNIFVVARAKKNLEPTIITTKKEQVFYKLGDYNGRIALFETDSQKPLMVYEVFTSSLPEKDAQNIKKGIKLTEDEVEKYLYDYTS